MDGKEFKLAEASPEAAKDVESGKKEQEPVAGAGTGGSGDLPGSGDAQAKGQEQLDPPYKGFDESGRYFVVKIDGRYGYLSILGFLQEAADWLKFQVGQQKRAQIEQAQKLIKPGGFMKKAAGKFNLFRGK